MARGTGLHEGSFDDVNKAHGDLVVRRESQVNGLPEIFASLFEKTIQFGSIPGLDVQAEKSHPEIAQKILKRLSKSASGNEWQGEL